MFAGEPLHGLVTAPVPLLLENENEVRRSEVRAGTLLHRRTPSAVHLCDLKTVDRDGPVHSVDDIMGYQNGSHQTRTKLLSEDKYLNTQKLCQFYTN